MASRKALSELYRPVGPKLIQSGIAWASGGSFNLTQAVDLSLPIRGIRMVFRGRLVIGGADFASVNPEGYLNLISNVTIQGTNARQKGNLTLWNIDQATAWVYSHLFSSRANQFTINGQAVAFPGTPFPPTGAGIAGGFDGTIGYINGAQGTYDFRIVTDFPFHLHASQVFGNANLTIPGFLVRNEEWKDSLQIALTFGTQVGGAVAGVLGTGAAATTVTFSQFGAAGGSPVIDLYSLPMVMGLDQKDSVLPGVISRVATPITTILQTAGTNVILNNMQKQPTPRVLLKVGVATVANAFTALSDANVTTLGILLGGNRNVRNVVDIFAHKQQQPDVYQRNPIQGYNLMDFEDSGNPDSAYPGQDIGDGATFQLTGTVAGVASAQGIVLQEQMLHMPTGPLYTF